MAEFIEVHCAGVEMLVNLNWVEEVRNDKKKGCTIYFAFSCPDSYDQDHITADESYEEVKRMIQKDR